MNVALICAEIVLFLLALAQFFSIIAKLAGS